jgi:glutaredoxin
MRKIHVQIYSRPNCHLCEEAKVVIEQTRAEVAFTLEEINIDDDSELQARYTNDVPVIFINGRKAFKHRVEARSLLKRLREVARQRT